MTTQIQANRKDLMAKLSGITEDNVSISNVAISRRKLLEALRLQTDDILIITHRRVSWQDKYKTSTSYDDHWRVEKVKNEPCIQISCNHTVMRFLNRPKAKWGTEPKIAPLNLTGKAGTKLTRIPLDPQDLIRALSFVLPCVDTQSGREVLHCLLFDSGKNTIKLVAADGFRLGIATLIAKGIPRDKVLIKDTDIARLLTFLKAVKPLGKGIHKVYPNVHLKYYDKAVKFATENGSIELERQKYTFPDYLKLIPNRGTKTEFISNDMLQAVKALSKIAFDGSGIIRLKFTRGINAYSPGKIQLSARSGYDEHKSSVECDAIVRSRGKIAVDAKYLLDLMRLCPDTRITMRTTTPSNPMVFEVNGNTEVIMPMFVQW